MPTVAGIDIGTRRSKAVVFCDACKRIVGRGATDTLHDLAGAAEKVFAAAKADAGVGDDEVVYIAATGYGRYQVPFRDVKITEISCNAKGAHFLLPETRSVIDLGAQNCRAILVSETGRVLRFRMNDKCAAGAGRFLERVARGLELALDDIGAASLRATDPRPISSICAVLAESEVINQVTLGFKVEDILMGTHQSLAERVVQLLRQVGVQPPVMFTGGVTRNMGMVKALEQRLELPVVVHPDAEYAGALGAALFAAERVRKLRAESGAGTAQGRHSHGAALRAEG